MDQWEALRDKVTMETDNLVDRAKSYREEILAEIDKAKADEVMLAIKQINQRLTTIEARLPESEGD